jgi:nucleoid DNA-binding protein
MIKGTVKYNPQNEQKYKMSDRCVVSFKATPAMNKLVNINRTPPVKV